MRRINPNNRTSSNRLNADAGADVRPCSAKSAEHLFVRMRSPRMNIARHKYLLLRKLYDEPRSASRLHHSRLRMCHRQVSRGGDQPRSRTTSRKRGRPAAATVIGGTTRFRSTGSLERLAPRLLEEGFLAHPHVWPINARVCPGRNIWAMSVLLKPFATVPGRRAANRFFLSDCVDVFRQLTATERRRHRHVPALQPGDPVQPVPGHALAGRLPRVDQHLGGGGGPRAAAGRLAVPERRRRSRATRGRRWTSRRPSRSHLRLQNIIHWVKSIAIERDLAGANAGLDRDLAVGHYKPINSDRFLNDCHEFVFHFTPTGATRLDRLALGVPYQDQSNIARWRGAAERRPLPRQHLVHPVRDHSAARSRSAASGDVPVAPRRAVSAAARAVADRDWRWIRSWGSGSTAVACARLGVEVHWRGYRRDLSGGSGERTREAVLDRAAADKRPAKARRGGAN